MSSDLSSQDQALPACQDKTLVARNNMNTLNTIKIPIVFLPGVMGSRLALGLLNWDPDGSIAYIPKIGFAWSWGNATVKQKRAALGWEGSDYADTNVVMDYEDYQKDYGRGGIVNSFYGAFLDLLKEHSFGSAIQTPVYAIGYDWRGDIQRKTAARIRARIKDIMDTEHATRIVIITHSMGGLVSRAMFKKFPDETQAYTAGVIHVVQPAVGAVVLYRRFFTGMQDSLDGAGFADSILNGILGRTPADFAALLSVLPGAMQLLPSGFYCRGTGWLHIERPGFPKNLPQNQTIYGSGGYGSTCSPPGIFSPELHYSDEKEDLVGADGVLSQAKELHDWLGTSKLEGKTWAIYSTGLKTDVEISFRPPLPETAETEESESPAGDGLNKIQPLEPDALKLQASTFPKDTYLVGGLAVVPGQRFEGDGTVPRNSASALFPGQAYPLPATASDLGSAKRQFKAEGVNHGDAFKNENAPVQNAVILLVQQAVNQAVAELKAGK
jgi:pimeloyl-ACP methyl ester carboxylesterase